MLEATIPLPITDFNDIPSLQKAIADVIMQNQNIFEPLLYRLIDMGDSGMSIIDDSLNIEPLDVDVDPDVGVAPGMFDSYFYAGCKDMTSIDEHDVALPFTIENGHLVFDIELPPAWIPEPY